jgi:anaerobic selenocysteine-containing dehydrogenase
MNAIAHPDAAANPDMNHGDSVHIETRRGRIRREVNVSTGVYPRVVIVDYAWWVPETDEVSLFGFMDSNYNVLTNYEPPFSKEVGSFNTRGLACRVPKAVS